MGRYHISRDEIWESYRLMGHRRRLFCFGRADTGIGLKLDDSLPVEGLGVRGLCR